MLFLQIRKDYKIHSLAMASINSFFYFFGKISRVHKCHCVCANILCSMGLHNSMFVWILSFNFGHSKNKLLELILQVISDARCGT